MLEAPSWFIWIWVGDIKRLAGRRERTNHLDRVARIVRPDAHAPVMFDSHPLRRGNIRRVCPSLRIEEKVSVVTTLLNAER